MVTVILYSGLRFIVGINSFTFVNGIIYSISTIFNGNFNAILL